MKVRKLNRNAWIAALIGIAAGLFSLGQVISVGWLVLTAAGSFGVWMIIWLWPEAVPVEN